MTNFEIIKSMSIDELAHFLVHTIDMCKSEEFCELCDHYVEAICRKESCIRWLNEEGEYYER